jgi:hypothetical protein
MLIDFIFATMTRPTLLINRNKRNKRKGQNKSNAGRNFCSLFTTCSFLGGGGGEPELTSPDSGSFLGWGRPELETDHRLPSI